MKQRNVRNRAWRRAYRHWRALPEGASMGLGLFRHVERYQNRGEAYFWLPR